MRAIKTAENRPMSKECSITRRGKKGIFHLRIVYPTRVLPFFKKTQHWESLKTDDPGIAIMRAAPKIEAYHRIVQSHATTDPTDFGHIKNACAAHGIDYETDTKLAAMSVVDSIEALSPRLSAWDRLAKPNDVQKVALAGATEPKLSLDELFARYQDLSSGKWADLDRDAKRKKFNRYAEPVTHFKATMGDRDVLDIKPSVAFEYAAKLGKLIDAKTMKSETAKKKLLFLNAIVRKVFQSDYPDNRNPFENAVIEHQGDGETRKPFTEDEIIAVRQAIASSNANDELKAISIVLELTGCHAKEIALLAPSDIHVGPDVEIPYIKIGVNENRRRLKTGGARHRSIPLVPEALEIFKRYPNGFPRYCYSGGAENLTQSMNKIIQTVAPDRTTYSYRHRLVDLLRNHKGVKDDCLKAIIGHNAGQTGDYGLGFDLESKLDGLLKALEQAKYLRSKNKKTN